MRCRNVGTRTRTHAHALLPSGTHTPARAPQAVNSHMDERPTSSAVRHMVEASMLESGEKLGSAMLPVWDAVKALQVGAAGVGVG